MSFVQIDVDKVERYHSTGRLEELGIRLETGLTEGAIVNPFAPTADDAATLIQACGITVD